MKLLGAFLISAACLLAHPMGNFSVNHYTRLEANSRGVQLRYVLDLAEIPTFELLRTWNVDRAAPPSEMNAHGTAQAREWLKHLRISVDGHPVEAKLESAKVSVADGAGNLPILRVDVLARVDDAGSRTLIFNDQNFPERAGWKEIVIGSGKGVSLVKASQSAKDLSEALTHYPPDPTVAPPQDLRAELEWRVNKPAPRRPVSTPAVQPVIVRIPQPAPVRGASSPVTRTAKAAPPGSVVRGDFLSQVLHRRQLTLPVILLALAAAFGLGAAHALTPGHGKTIVAAYLVGSRGTLKHAAFLGVMVTFTHTVAVFALGLATLFLFRYVVPEKITVVLGAISGLSIVTVGAWMLHKRIAANNHAHSHPHSHSHPHTYHHHHDHDHAHSHSHVPDEISWAGLTALGISGGLVPCESALILLLGAIALGRVGLGLILLLCFSVGLAVVLMLIGILVLYAKNLMPDGTRSGSRAFFRWVSIASPAVVILVGLVMTGVSLGWIQTKWMIG